MSMAVMRVRKVGMGVLHRVVPVRVAVRGTRRNVRRVGVAVVFVVHMGMVVLHRFVLMGMLMALAQMQPESACHQGAGSQQTGRQRFADEQRQDRSCTLLLLTASLTAALSLSTIAGGVPFGTTSAPHEKTS